MSQLPLLAEVKTFFPSTRKDVLETLILLVHCFIRCRTVCLYKCRAEAGAILNKKDINLDSVYRRFTFFLQQERRCALRGSSQADYPPDQDAGCCVFGHGQNQLENRTGEHQHAVHRLAVSGRSVCAGIVETFEQTGQLLHCRAPGIDESLLSVWQHLENSSVTVLADREFIGLDWFVRLRKANFSLVIRVRFQDYLPLVAQSLGKTIDQTQRLMLRKVKRNGFFQASFTVGEHGFYYTVLPNTGARKGKDKWLILISDQQGIALISATYRKRWGIEVFFLHCKTNGLNLEDLNLKAPGKTQLMIGLVAVAYCLAVAEGLRLEKKKPCKIKHSKNLYFRSISIFRLGSDHLKNRLHRLFDLKHWQLRCLRCNRVLNLKKPALVVLLKSIQ